MTQRESLVQRKARAKGADGEPTESWQNPPGSLWRHTVSELAKELGIDKHLHLWPDKSLGSQALADRMSNPRQYLKRLEHWWHRVSEWPK
jgi:hypothetical protein